MVEATTAHDSATDTTASSAAAAGDKQGKHGKGAERGNGADKASSQDGLNDVRNQTFGQSSGRGSSGADKGGATTQLEKDAEAIRKATGSDNTFLRLSDSDAINKILESRSADERQKMDAIYQKKYGTSIEKDVRSFESGAELDRFLNVLHRQDGDQSDQSARRIHQDMLENSQTFGGRSSSQIEKDIRDTLATHNSDQIAKMNETYQKQYGQSLSDAIAKNPDLSDATKQMAAIYLKGNDKRTDEDQKKLIDLSLSTGNLDQFAEAMRDASPKVRQDFAENGGMKKLSNVFSGKDLEHATDFAQHGKLDAATQVKDNTGFISNNDKGIEQALNGMTPAERTMYQNGKLLSENKDVAGLSFDDQTAAKAYYDKLHSALTGAGNDTKVAQWESMIADNGNSLISSLVKHRGMLYNSGADDIAKDVAGMSKSEWQDIKQHPERRQEMETMLKSLDLGKPDVDKIMSMYDRKAAAQTYDQAKDIGYKSATEQLSDASHWYGTNRNATLDSIANMSAADQDKYRHDATYRQQVDDQVKNAFSGGSTDADAQESAKRMLQQIKDGKSPTSDPISQLERIQNYDGSKTQDVVGSIEQAFKQDPKLQDRIANPKTEEDRRYSDAFKKAAKNAFGDDYEVFGKPLVDTGHLPIEQKMSLDKGILSNDYNRAFEDLQQATPQEKERLRNDPEYREKVLGFMNQDRQQIALATMDQKQMQPEDKIRADIVGWGGSSEILDELKGLKPGDLDRARQDYAKKYGSSFDGDLMGKLSEHDKVEAQRVLTQKLTTDERADIARTETERTRSGVGAWVADNVLNSGTGAQADNALNQTDAALSDKNKAEHIIQDTPLGKKLTSDQVAVAEHRLNEQVDHQVTLQNQATDNHVETKQSVGEYASYGAMAVGAVASVVATGGADAPVLSALAVTASGAALRPLTKAALEGSDYDSSASGIAKDMAIGAAGGAGTVGMGEVAAAVGIGRMAAASAAEAAAQQVGTQSLVEGGKDLLTQGTTTILKQALASGGTLNEDAFAQLADLAVAPGTPARDQVVTSLAENLHQQVSTRLAGNATATIVDNTAGGAIAGGSVGATQGATDWDSQKTAEQNLSHIAERAGEGAVTGAALGAVASGAPMAFKALGRGRAGAESPAEVPMIEAQPAPAPEVRVSEPPALPGAAHEAAPTEVEIIPPARNAGGQADVPRLEYHPSEPAETAPPEVPEGGRGTGGAGRANAPSETPAPTRTGGEGEGEPATAPQGQRAGVEFKPPADGEAEPVISPEGQRAVVPYRSPGEGEAEPASPSEGQLVRMGDRTAREGEGEPVSPPERQLVRMGDRTAREGEGEPVNPPERQLAVAEQKPRVADEGAPPNDIKIVQPSGGVPEVTPAVVPQEKTPVVVPPEQSHKDDPTKVKHTEHWGSRDFTVYPDGSAEYAIKKGDNVWSVAKDALKQKLDHEPTAKEILLATRAISKATRLHNANLINPNHSLIIPADLPTK